MNSKHRTRNRIAFAVALALVLVVAELSARFYIFYRGALDLQHRHEQQPQADEVLNIHMHMTDYGMAYDNFYGQFHTIIDGERLTKDQPHDATRTLWVFGSSTVFDYYTSDVDTMASQLQRLLNSDAYRWRVRNEGISGLRISGELARLRNTAIRRGDVVLFIDGWADSSFDGEKCDVERLALADLVCRGIGPIFHLQSDPVAYWRSVSNAKRYTENAGATFYHFVQPVRDTYLFAPPFVTLPDYAYVDEGHLNARGNAIVAAALYDALTLI